jgi:transaldolase/glucose-6-phosphate isomerase
VEARLATWADTDANARFWRKDPTFWPQASPEDLAGGLGWLRAPEQSAARVGELRAFAEELTRDGIEHVVLFGMGGSSLAPEVIRRVFPPVQGRPDLSVLDSTHPAAVRACADRTPLDRTLFLVSSKSGTTLEPNVLFRFFWERVGKRSASPGGQFVAITDPGTPLERLARERRFRTCIAAPADVGGRYSALTVFGLIPAALLGVDLEGLLGSARAMVARCADPTDGRRNPGFRLGAALGELAEAGRDKVVFLTSRSLRPLPAWIEQLVAESLGKRGRGIVPVATAPPRTELPRGSDVVFVHFTLEGEGDPALERALDAREAGGTPVLRFELGSPLDLGREFFRWEFAVAACGSVLEVDPFDQPDVEHAKELAREAMGRQGGPVATSPGYGTRVGPDLGPGLEGWIATARAGDYVAVQAFLEPNDRTDAALARVASQLRQRLSTVVTVGYGPRFLHSTGQLHKGGPASGLYLQVVDDPDQDLEVPELGFTFGQLIRAQAKGDRGALEQRRRRLLVVNVGSQPLEGLNALANLLGRVPPDAATRS